MRFFSSFLPSFLIKIIANCCGKSLPIAPIPDWTGKYPSKTAKLYFHPPLIREILLNDAHINKSWKPFQFHQHRSFSTLLVLFAFCERVTLFTFIRIHCTRDSFLQSQKWNQSNLHGTICRCHSLASTHQTDAPFKI